MVRWKATLPYLKALDRGFEKVGGKRNKAKTMAILYATDEQHAREAHTWRLPELQELCALKDASAHLRSLGAAIGGMQSQAELFRRKTAVVNAMHGQLRSVQDAAVETV